MSRSSKRLRQAVLAIICLAGAGDALAQGPTQAARGRLGVVASADLDASRAGTAVLRAGGNAVDAAVATAYALSVVEPFSAGLGGGGFLLYFDAKTKKTTVIDYREVAPKKAHRDMYLVNGKVDPKLSTEGILAVAVPGMVPGLDVAQKKFGKKKLADVVKPAIALAENGFLVQERFYEASVAMTEMLRANDEAARVFLKDGAPYEIGERLKQPELAKTLRELSRSGARLFTHGRVAQAMAAESKRLNGALALEDLKAFQPRFREPLTGDYLGYTVVTMPPPSSGGTHLLQMLEMLELDQKKRPNDRAKPSANNIHMLAEIMRRAFADRATYMGDPAFVKVPVAELLAEKYLGERYASIDPSKATPSSTVKAGLGPRESEHTTHLTVIDRWGNVATLTQTVNALWGSGVVVPKTGVLLNNEMDDFAAAPGVPNIFGLVGGEANSVQPGKIPLSSMTPTIVLKDGQVRLALGAPGGPTIITTVLQIIVHVLEHGMDAGAAIAAPRVHMQWLPDQVNVESGTVERAVIDDLTKRGWKVNERGSWGNASVIEVRADGMRAGFADPRGDGAADAE